MKKLLIILGLVLVVTFSYGQYCGDYIEKGHLFYSVQSDSLSYTLRSGVLLGDYMLVHIPLWTIGFKPLSENNVNVNVYYQVYQNNQHFLSNPQGGNTSLQIGRITFELGVSQANFLQYIDGLIKNKLATELNVDISAVTRIVQ